MDWENTEQKKTTFPDRKSDSSDHNLYTRAPNRRVPIGSIPKSDWTLSELALGDFVAAGLFGLVEALVGEGDDVFWAVVGVGGFGYAHAYCDIEL